MSAKNIDDVISGPAYDKPPERDPVMAYYERIREKSRAIWELMDKARQLGAPKSLLDAMDEWHDRESNTGD